MRGRLPKTGARRVGQLSENGTTYVFPPARNWTGVSFIGSTVSAGQITDGTAKTYLIGESQLATQHYDTGLIEADRGHMYIGMAPDTVRMAEQTVRPSQDNSKSGYKGFGSAHHVSFNMSFCDGSVRFINYDIEGLTHERYGNRRDNEVVP